MKIEHVLVIVAIAWVIGTYGYFFLKRGKPILKPDQKKAEDVLVNTQKFVVNVIYQDDDNLDHHLLADMVVNYKDLINGTYSANNLKSEKSLADEVKHEVVVDDRKEEEPEVPEVVESSDDIPEPDQQDDTSSNNNSSAIIDVTNHNFNI